MSLFTVSPGDRVELKYTILCTGDGDFLPVVARLQDAGVTVEIVSFATTLSDSLRNTADNHQ